LFERKIITGEMKQTVEENFVALLGVTQELVVVHDLIVRGVLRVKAVVALIVGRDECLEGLQDAL
jgi:hypothetical protein